MNTKKRAVGILLAGAGFILSPLSWWNDSVVNIPLAYGFAFPFGLLYDRAFLPMFVIGYIITNVAGMVMLHQGYLLSTKANRKEINLCRVLAVSTAYTVLVVLLILFHVIPEPKQVMSWLQQ